MGDLKAIRKAAGLSQIEVSRRASVSRFRISLAETGALELTPQEQVAIRSAVRPEIEKTARIAEEFKSLATAIT
jgi:transcriptional regulator with XRE-family HTH domain